MARQENRTGKSGNRHMQNGGITPRQKEILRLVVAGDTNREIAGRLSISVRTVDVHRYHLMRHLKVRNVSQLMRRAFSCKLLPKTFPSR